MSEKEFVQMIWEEAKALGACERFRVVGTKVETVRELIKLLQTPQGAEFCTEHNFPSLALWEEADRRFNLYQYGIYVGQEVNSYRHKDIFYVGSKGRITCEHPQPYRVYLLHGSRVEICATGYAVVSVDTSPDSSFSIKEADSTVMIL